jgi:hypothetical protein
LTCVVAEFGAADGENDAKVAAAVGEEEDEDGGAAGEGKFGVGGWWGFEGAEAS